MRNIVEHFFPSNEKKNQVKSQYVVLCMPGTHHRNNIEDTLFILFISGSVNACAQQNKNTKESNQIPLPNYKTKLENNRNNARQY